MSTITYEDVKPKYKNTTMRKFLIDGIHKQFEIKAVDGYVLHDNRHDSKEMNLETMEETLKLGFTTASVSCRHDYDFEANPFGFYAVKE